MVFLSLHGTSTSIRAKGENPIRKDKSINGTVSALPRCHGLLYQADVSHLPFRASPVTAIFMAKTIRR